MVHILISKLHISTYNGGTKKYCLPCVAVYSFYFGMMLPLVTLILFSLTSSRKGPNNAIASSRAKSQKTELLSSKMDSHKPLRRYVAFVKYFFKMDVINIVVKGYCVRLGSRVFKYFFKT